MKSLYISKYILCLNLHFGTVQEEKKKRQLVEVMIKLFEAFSLTLTVSKTLCKRCFDCCCLCPELGIHYCDINI